MLTTCVAASTGWRVVAECRCTAASQRISSSSSAGRRHARKGKRRLPRLAEAAARLPTLSLFYYNRSLPHYFLTSQSTSVHSPAYQRIPARASTLLAATRALLQRLAGRFRGRQPEPPRSVKTSRPIRVHLAGAPPQLDCGTNMASGLKRDHWLPCFISATLDAR